jgi:CDP-diglyceride synthetase
MHTLTTILAQASGNQEAAAQFGALLALIAGFGMILVAGIVVVTLIGMWKVFTKAGEPGWAVLVPIYNLIVLLRIAGLPWYWVFAPFVAIIPILGWIAYMVWIVWVHHRISTRFGQGVGFTIGLTLLGPIFWLILGFGSSKYVAEQPAQA